MSGAFDVSDRRVVVTGASSGIGEGIAAAFGRAGARVAGISLEGGGPVEGIFVRGDTGDRETVEGLARRVVEEWGGIDVWVSNAARLLVRPLVEMSDEDWHGLLRGNLHGYFYGCRAAARQMLAQDGGGRIVNVSSVAGRQAGAGGAVYNMTKFGVHGFSEALRQEALHADVRVTVVAPGHVDTELQGHNLNPVVRAGLDRAREQIGKVLAAEDIAEAILHAVTRPRHVCFNEVVVRPTGQSR